MKERPILFSTLMVQAILDGRKTMTRRVCKGARELSCAMDWPIASCPYGQVGDRLWCRQRHAIVNDSLVKDIDILYELHDDRLYAILISSEVQDGRYKVAEWSPFEKHPDIPERGLHGRFGRTDLLKNKIQRLWEKEIRGLVSAQRTQQWEGIPDYHYEPREPQGKQECSQVNLYGFSWDAPTPIFSSEAFRQQSNKQSAIQPKMGDTRRELDGQENGRERERGRETSKCEINRLRDESTQMGYREGFSEPTSCCEDTWDVAGWNIRRCSSGIIKKIPSIFMPRWASRITLEITNIRVERLQDISPEDAVNEGAEYMPAADLRKERLTVSQIVFAGFWDKLNTKRGYSWESNPWVWVIEFMREVGQ